MAISFVAAGSFDAANGTGTNTPGNPAGIQANDVLICVISNFGTTSTTHSFSTGTWVKISGPLGSNNGTSDLLTVYYSVYNGTDGAPTITHTNVNNVHTAQIAAYRGVDTTTPIDAGPWDDWGTLSSGTYVVPNNGSQPTTATNGAWLFHAYTAGRSEVVNSFTNTNLVSPTIDFASGTTTGNDASIALMRGEDTTAGSTGTSNVGTSGTRSDAYANISFALLPGSSAQTVSLSSIASAEAFGSTTVIIDQTISPTGIASAETFGTSQVNLNIAATGIPSAEAFGTPQLNFTITAVAIASAEAFGNTTVLADQTISPSSIPSTEVFGTASVSQLISATGIASGEAFGSPTLTATYTISLTGIASEEAFGTTTVTNLGGLQTISPTGLVSEEAFGTAQLNLNISLSGIPSAETFGTAEVTIGSPQTVTFTGLASAEAFGTTTVTQQQFISPVSIGSQEVFGNHQVFDPELGPIIARGSLIYGKKRTKPYRKTKNEKTVEKLVREELDKLFGSEYNNLLRDILEFTALDKEVLIQELNAEKAKVRALLEQFIQNRKDIFQSYLVILDEREEQSDRINKQAVIETRITQLKNLATVAQQQEKQAVIRARQLIEDQVKQALNNTVTELINTKLEKIRKRRRNDNKLIVLVEAFEIALIEDFEMQLLRDIFNDRT